MKLRKIGIIVALISTILCCAAVGWDSIKKRFRQKDPEIVFFKNKTPVYTTRTTIRDAENILTSNKEKFDFYEITD